MVRYTFGRPTRTVLFDVVDALSNNRRQLDAIVAFAALHGQRERHPEHGLLLLRHRWNTVTGHTQGTHGTQAPPPSPLEHGHRSHTGNTRNQGSSSVTAGTQSQVTHREHTEPRLLLLRHCWNTITGHTQGTHGTQAPPPSLLEHGHRSHTGNTRNPGSSSVTAGTRSQVTHREHTEPRLLLLRHCWNTVTGHTRGTHGTQAPPPSPLEQGHRSHTENTRNPGSSSVTAGTRSQVTHGEHTEPRLLLRHYWYTVTGHTRRTHGTQAPPPSQLEHGHRSHTENTRNPGSSSVTAGTRSQVTHREHTEPRLLLRHYWYTVTGHTEGTHGTQAPPPSLLVHGHRSHRGNSRPAAWVVLFCQSTDQIPHMMQPSLKNM